MRAVTLAEVKRQCDWVSKRTCGSPNCKVCPLYGKMIKLTECDGDVLEQVNLRLNACLLVNEILGQIREPKEMPDVIDERFREKWETERGGKQDG